MSEPLWQPRTDLAARLLGAGFFAGGSGLLAYQVAAVRDAVTTQADVTFSIAAIAMGTMATLLGAYWLIYGLAGYTTIRTLQANPRAMRTLMFVTAGVLVVVVVGVRAWLSSLGYNG